MEIFKDIERSLYIWGSDCSSEMEDKVNELKSVTGGAVLVENFNRLTLASHASSNFNLIVIGTLTEIEPEIFVLLLKLLKPSGKLCLTKFNSSDKILSNLKLSGYINGKLDNNLIICEKPSYEIGSAVKLSFGQKNQTPSNIKKVWTVSANDDDDDEIIDENALLDEDDLKKPDPSSLRVCGTTGKRKACKNCSCGLAAELEAEAKGSINTKDAKSSCGSCYLGDAFRCSTCPYMGMPAFKPGEQVKLDLKDDL